ncbi:hypothetical protein [Penaeicola halotolerans]|uniref:hypothetical protein n=1 Tax=Penaeicola halotolerans TaxID=2793196 RepID=UPI001CF8D0D3|nr:hypothetical protein [Penaeicola halotolerans]
MTKEAFSAKHDIYNRQADLLKFIFNFLKSPTHQRTGNWPMEKQDENCDLIMQRVWREMTHLAYLAHMSQIDTFVAYGVYVALYRGVLTL